MVGIPIYILFDVPSLVAGCCKYLQLNNIYQTGLKKISIKIKLGLENEKQGPVTTKQPVPRIMSSPPHMCAQEAPIS